MHESPFRFHSLTLAGVAAVLCSIWLCRWPALIGNPRSDALVILGSLIGTVACVVGVFGSTKGLRGGVLVSVSVTLLLFAGLIAVVSTSQVNVHRCGLLIAIWVAGTTLGVAAILIRGLFVTWRT